MDDEYDDRSAVVRGALLKGVGVIVVIGIVIALGTTVLVRALGLDSPAKPDPVGTPSAPSPLPTTALPTSEQPTPSPSADPSPSGGGSESASTAPPTPRPGARGLVLEVSPVIAGPNERINLTGTYRRADNVQLAVQRFEGGTWKDFGVSATVRVGTFTTYVFTGRTGENRFRVYDPQARKASNEVRVTVQ